jgi:hypothetical protein
MTLYVRCDVRAPVPGGPAAGGEGEVPDGRRGRGQRPQQEHSLSYSTIYLIIIAEKFSLWLT